MEDSIDATPQASSGREGADARPAEPEREQALLSERLQQVSEALRASEARYERLTQAVTDYVYTVQVQDGCAAKTSHGPGCLAVTGYSGEDFAADPLLWHRVIAPEDRSAVEDHARRVLAGEKVDAIEHRLIRRDGCVRWVRNTPLLHRDAAGRLLAYDGLIRDITERREAEEALRRSEEDYEDLVASVKTAIVVHDADTRVLMHNQEAAMLLDLSEAQLRARTAADPGWRLLREDGTMLPLDEYPVMQVRATKRPLENRIFGIHRPTRGDTVWVMMNAIPELDRLGALRRIIVTFMDVTERKRMEAALRDSEELLRAQFVNSPDIVLILDSQHRFVRVNRAAIGPYAAEELLGRDAIAVLPAHVQEAVRDKVAACFATAAIQEIDHEMSGGAWVRARIAPIWKNGTVEQVMVISADITERRQVEEEKRRLQAQLIQAQRMEAIGRLAGGIAHDFNNLLMAILGYTELNLLECDEMLPAAQSLLGIRDIVLRAKTLTQQILAFSRRQVLTMTVVDLNAELVTAARMLQRLIGEHIVITIHLEPALGRVRADSSQVQQVLMNLALNARDAMPQGGTLTLSTANVSLDAERALALPEARPGDYVLLTVTDTGAGMDAATLSHLFEPFFTTKELGRGTGLGLATVYGVVKQHEGHIDVQSAPGAGATFRIYLPRLPQEARPAAADSDAPLPAVGGDETILLVEDEAMVRDLTEQRLAACGYRVLCAANPGEALELARRHPGPIHLLLTDVVMPGMNGRELQRQLAADRHETKVLYMSGYAGDALADHGGALEGGLHFIQKPFGIAELTRKLRGVLESSA